MSILDFLYISLSIGIWVLIFGFLLIVWQVVATMRSLRFFAAQAGKTALQFNILQTAMKVGALGFIKNLFRNIGREVRD